MDICDEKQSYYVKNLRNIMSTLYNRIYTDNKIYTDNEKITERRESFSARCSERD